MRIAFIIRLMSRTILNVPCILIALIGCTKHGDDFGNLSGIPAPAESVEQSVQNELIDVVERSIAAHGGEIRIQQLRGASRVEINGSGAFAPGIDGNFELIDLFQPPAQLRREVKASTESESADMLFVCSGNKTWAKLGQGEVMEMPQGRSVEPFPYALFQGMLNLKMERYQLSRDYSVDSGEIRIDLRTEQGYAGSLVFDRESLLYKANIKPVPDFESGDWYTSTTVFSEYVTQYGVVIPTKIDSYRDDEIMYTAKITKIELVDSLDESLFEKPD